MKLGIGRIRAVLSVWKPMTKTFLFERHVIETYNGHDRVLGLKGKSIISFSGPAGSGKTSALQTLLYPLGIDAKFRRAVRENVCTASTTINIDGSSLRFVRSLAHRRNFIQVYAPSGDGRIATLDTTGKRGPTPSQWLFEQMGIEELFADVRLGSGRNAGPATFADLLPCFYINQEDNDRQIMRHLSHDAARRTVFELLLGISNADVQGAKARLAELDRRLSELKRRITTIEAFLHDDPAEADELREELRRATAEAERAARQLKQLRRRFTAQLPKSHNGHVQPPAGSWTHCPRCQAPLDPSTVPNGCCLLCRQPETPAPPPGSEGSTGRPGVVDLEGLAEAHAQAARTAERVIGLRRLLEPYQRLVQLREELAKLQTERTEAAADLEAASQNAARYRSRLTDFSTRFGDVVAELRPPWYQRDARIDFDTYLPVVETDTFDELGGGVRSCVNVAYHIALLSYALITGATDVPSVLIIDSPRRNLGSNTVDRALAHRIYDHFLRFQEIREGLIQRPFQLIVADNDVPVAASKAARRFSFTHEEPFVPGVKYAP